MGAGAAAGHAHGAAVSSTAAAPPSGAPALTTVGDVCKDRGNQHVAVGLRRWAAMCLPQGHSTCAAAVDAMLVDDLLQHWRLLTPHARKTTPGSAAAREAVAEALLLLQWAKAYKAGQGMAVSEPLGRAGHGPVTAAQSVGKQASSAPGSPAAVAGAAGSHAGAAAAAPTSAATAEAVAAAAGASSPSTTRAAAAGTVTSATAAGDPADAVQAVG